MRLQSNAKFEINGKNITRIIQADRPTSINENRQTDEKIRKVRFSTKKETNKPTRHENSRNPTINNGATAPAQN